MKKYYHSKTNKELSVLRLTLKDNSKEPWFSLTKSGIKKLEIRNNSKWIRSRLFDKNGEKRIYDLIEYSNGYGENVPKFACKFNGFFTGRKGALKLPGNFIIQFNKNDFLIRNGKTFNK
jgi:uncharacterized membrane-anchored protein